MKKILTILLVILGLQSTIGNAEKEYYTALCIVDESVGFNWENGGWTSVNFKPNKYLVERIEMKEWSAEERSWECLSKYNRKNMELIKMTGSDYGCYNVRRFGSEFYQHRSELCFELSRDPDKEPEVIMCKNFSFLPNGAFQASSINSELSPTPKDGHKDSLSVSVGTCSKL